MPGAVIGLFFIGFLSGQSNYYDLDQDHLQDEVVLENNLVSIHFGNKKTETFEVPEITAFSNTNLGYTNPSEIIIHYSGDKGLYGAIHFLYKKGWYVKNVNFYIPCQECEDQHFKILTKNINLPIKKINPEALEIDSKGFKSLTFFDYEGIIKPYKDLKKLFIDLSHYPLLADRFNEAELLDFKKIFPLSQKNIDDYNSIAFILSNNGNQKIAIQLLTEIIRKYPKNSAAYFNLAYCYWNVGKINEAKENYKKYLTFMKSQKKDAIPLH